MRTRWAVKGCKDTIARGIHYAAAATRDFLANLMLKLSTRSGQRAFPNACALGRLYNVDEGDGCKNTVCVRAIGSKQVKGIIRAHHRDLRIYTDLSLELLGVVARNRPTAFPKELAEVVFARIRLASRRSVATYQDWPYRHAALHTQQNAAYKSAPAA